MENKYVGVIIIGISVVMTIVIFLFNSTLKEIVSTTCTHGPQCSMYGTITTQTYISLTIVALLFLTGVGIMFIKPKEKIILKEVEKEVPKKEINLNDFEKDERKVIEILQEEKGGMFQADLMEKLEVGKVGMTRLLDKLEAKQVIERKRRGMNNIVILRQ
jgi:hypothetical protein